ncbi:acyltransferase family protein [Herbaspirillum sp. NPDC101396]|uniref:acyltransferase family protein n=1 Tax=Herbaspirillum sp. NPDC101396 TaxID=3364005 RepID=UPI00383B9367
MGLGTLRLLLAFGVVASHTHGYIFSRYPDTGIIAVVTFFFISGYLIPAAFQTHYTNGSVLIRIRNYLVNRLLRIYPIYWIAGTLALAVIILKGQTANYDLSIKSLVQNALLLGLNQETLWHNDTKLIGPAWTLDIEMQFYLLTPMLVLLRQQLPRFFFWLVCGVSFAGVVLLIKPVGSSSIDRSIFPYFIFFCLGMLAYEQRKRIPGFVRSCTWRVLLITFGLAAMFVASRPEQTQWLLASLMLLLTLPLLPQPSSRKDRYLGDLSYPVFVLHSPLIILNIWGQHSFFTTLFLNIGTTTIAAVLLHPLVSRYIEKVRSGNKDRSASAIVSLNTIGTSPKDAS